MMRVDTFFRHDFYGLVARPEDDFIGYNNKSKMLKTVPYVDTLEVINRVALISTRQAKEEKKMGYTHYFEHTKIDKETWDLIKNDIIAAHALISKDIKINGCEKYGRQTHFGNEEIWFNGNPGHETFVLNREGSGGFTFCKTARKPYDLFVCICLLVYKHHSPTTMKLSSDGDAEDWLQAETFIERWLGYKDTFAKHEDKD